MRIGLVLLLAGCDRLFGFEPVPATATDASGSAHDAAADSIAADSIAADSGGRSIDASKPPPILVQQSTNENDSTGLDVQLAAKPADGDTLVMIGGAECGLAQVSGGGVTTWQLAARSEVSSTIYIYYGVSDGTSVIVHLRPQCTAKTWGLVTEWSGLAMSAFDTMNASGMSGVSNGTLNMAVYPSAGDDLLIFGMASYGPLGSPSPEWMQLNPVTASTITQRTWYQVVPTMAQYFANVTYSNDYDAAAAAFKAAP